MRLLKVLTAILFLALTACSYLNNSGIIQVRDKEYLKAKSVPPLAIPPGLSSSTIHTKYPAPEQIKPENLKEVDLTPPGLYSN